MWAIRGNGTLYCASGITGIAGGDIEQVPPIALVGAEVENSRQGPAGYPFKAHATLQDRNYHRKLPVSKEGHFTRCRVDHGPCHANIQRYLFLIGDH